MINNTNFNPKSIIKFVKNIILAGVAFIAFLIAIQLLPFYQSDNINISADRLSKLVAGDEKERSKNHVLISQDAQESTDWKMKLIRHAQQSIELSGCFCGGKIFDDCLKLIDERLHLHPKLQVRILSMSDLVTSSNRKLIQMLKAKFPTQFHYLETARRIQFFPHIQTFENHQKQLIVDEKYFVIGGSNLSDECNRKTNEIEEIENLSFMEWLIGAGMNDMDAIVSGPLARLVRLDFYRLWAKWKTYQLFGKDSALLPSEYFPLDRLQSIENNQTQPAAIPEFDAYNPRVIRNVDMFFVSGGSEDFERSMCAQTFQQLFDEARQTIWIGNMVFNEERLINRLREATLRNVFVTVITNGNREGETSIGKRALGAANRRNYSRLAKDGSAFYEYDIPAEVYHKKVAIIDAKITIIGSMNISSKSVACDDESILVMDSKEVAQAMKEILVQDIARSAEVRREEIETYQKGWNWLIGQAASWMNQYKMN